MKTTEENQNQQELSFEQLLDFNNFSLDEPANTDEPELEIKVSEEEEEEEEVVVPEPKAKPELELETPKSKEDEGISFNEEPSIYSELIKEKLESGEWEDVLVETEDGEEVLLSELKTLDKDTYKTLEKEILSQKEEEFKTKFVSVDGLDETKKRLINIIKEGDFELAKSLFQNPDALKEPFQGYDSENDAHNEQVLAWYYQNTLGHSASETRALVNAAKGDLTIDSKANQIVNYQRSQFHESLLKKEQDLLKEKAEEVNKIKEYRKQLSSAFKEEGISETLAKKFTDVATKKTSNGEYEIDTIYDEWMSDPKKAKELLFFMLDKDNYLKKVTSEVKKNVQLDNLKKIRIVQDTTKIDKKKKEEDKPITPFETLNFDL
jgi:hypothetical protein